MDVFMKLTRQKMVTLRSDINALLEDAGLAGVEMSLGNGSYTESEAHFKLNIKVAGVKSSTERDLVTFGQLDNINVFATGPKGQKLVEYHSKKRKYPYIYETVRGARYKASAQSARNLFGSATKVTT